MHLTDGIIKNCYNAADIYLTLNVEDPSKGAGSRAGGVVGVNETSGTGSGDVENVYNIGKLTLNNNIISGTMYHHWGGVCGLNFGKIVNGYNIGEINNLYFKFIVRLGPIVGLNDGDSYQFTNGYYLKNTINANNSGNESINSLGTEKTSEEMRTQSFVDTLNGTDSNWKRDLNNINNGYPIFNWQ